VPVVCFTTFLVVWIALAIHPRSRDTWVLENLVTFVVVPLLAITHRRFPFSNRAYIQTTIFLVLHTIGSHYTYSEVPFGDWMRERFDLERNHYDRAVHFAAGLLLTTANREAMFRGVARLSRTRELVLAFTMMAWWSLLYELVEWVAAIVVDPAAGAAFLGTQGDPWDAQKDMALASAGAAIACLIELSISTFGAGARRRAR
jgi:putative membrane protein